MTFANRKDAGMRLAGLLASYKPARPVVVALPRGGVPVGAEVALALDAPLDIILVRKIGLPQQPEIAAGAIVDGATPIIIRNEDVIQSAGLSEELFRRIASAELTEIRRRRNLYLHHCPHIDLTDRTVIVVDDGIATAATVRAALQAIRQYNPGRLVVAVPVGPTDTVAELRRQADDVVCAEEHDPFSAIGSYYLDFRQLEDAEVIEALDRALARTGRTGVPRS